MKGWVVYDSEGAKRNAWFMQKLIDECRGLGLDVEGKILDAPDEKLPLPDFAIVRTMNTQIGEWLDEKGVRLFNNARLQKTACDKWETYLFCKQNDIPVLDTKLVGEEPPFAYPFVVKARDGHGGSEVFLCREEKEWKTLCKRIEKTRYIAQPLCDETGKDMRVYMLGGRVLAAMLRTSKSDFRSNFSLGGKAEVAQVDESQRQILNRVARLLSPDFCGVDFIRHQGKWIVNEMEDPVGARMLYEHTDMDVAREFANYINQKIAKN